MLARGVWGIYRKGNTKFLELQGEWDITKIIKHVQSAMSLLKYKGNMDILVKLYDAIYYREDMNTKYDLVQLLNLMINDNRKRMYIMEPVISIFDSVYCEWAYIINLNSLELEIYKGLNTKKNLQGRYFLDVPRGKHYACKLVAVINLASVCSCNTNLIKKFKY